MSLKLKNVKLEKTGDVEYKIQVWPFTQIII